MDNPDFMRAAEKALRALDERLKKPNRLDALNLSFSGAMIDIAALQKYGWRDETLDSSGERKFYKGAIVFSRRVADCVFVVLASPLQREDHEFEDWNYCFFREGDEQRWKSGEIKAYARCWAIRLDRVDDKDGLFSMDDSADDDVSDQTLATIRRELDGATAEFPGSLLSDIYAIAQGIRPKDDDILSRDDINAAAEEFADFLLNEADRCAYSAIRFLYSYLRVLTNPGRHPKSVEGVSRIYCSYFFLSVFFVATDFLPVASRLGMLAISDTLRRLLDGVIECEPDDIAFVARAMTRVSLFELAVECWDWHFDARADLVPVDELEEDEDAKDEDDDDDIDIDDYDDEDDDGLPSSSSGAGNPDWDFGWDVDDREEKSDDSLSYDPDDMDEREKSFRRTMKQSRRIREFWDALLSFVRSEAKAAEKEKKRFPEGVARRVLDLLEKYAPYIPGGYDFPRKELVALLTCALNPPDTPSMKVTEFATAFFEARFDQLKAEDRLSGDYEPAVEDPLMWEALECNGDDVAITAALSVFPDVYYEFPRPNFRRRIPSRIVYGLYQADIWAFAGSSVRKRLDQIKNEMLRKGKLIRDDDYHFEIGGHTICNQSLKHIRAIASGAGADVEMFVFDTDPESAPDAMYPDFYVGQANPRPNACVYVTRRYGYKDGIGGEYEMQIADSPVSDFDCITAFAPQYYMLQRFLLHNVKYPAYICAQVLSVEDPGRCHKSASFRARSHFAQCARDNRLDKNDWKCAMAEVDCGDRSRAIYDICGKIVSYEAVKIHKGGWIYKITLWMNGCVSLALPVYVHPGMLVSTPRRGAYFAARVVLNCTILINIKGSIEEYKQIFTQDKGPWDEVFEFERRTRDFGRVPAQRIFEPVSFDAILAPVGGGSVAKIPAREWAVPHDVTAVEDFDYRGNALYMLRQIYGWENVYIWSDNPFGIDLSAVDKKGKFLYWHVVCATPSNPEPQRHPTLPTLVVRLLERSYSCYDVVYENFPLPSSWKIC